MSGCPYHNISAIKEFDALDKDARSNPWPYYDWLRDISPEGVYKLPNEKNYYVLHRYEDVKNAFADAVTFSSKIIPVKKSPFLALMDGEEHSRIRKVVSGIFTVSFLEHHQHEIYSIIDDATNRLVEKRNPELFEEWADKIPLAVLSHIFGLPETEEAIKKLHDDNIRINRALFVTGGTGSRRSQNPSFGEKIKISWALLKDYRKIIKLKRLLGSENFSEFLTMFSPVKNGLETPRPDFNAIPDAIVPMLDLLLHFAEQFQDGRRTTKANSIFLEAINNSGASKAEMIMAGAFIIFAGYETTASLLSNCFMHLSRYPDLFKELKAHPERIEDFMEESLRYYTPVGRFLRRTTSDVSVNGKQIPKDSIVMLLPAAANTDPEKFNDGCGFDLKRDNNRQHLSFGKGPHFCIGAPLARMQVMYALRSLISKFDKLEIDESVKLQMVVDRDNGILRYEKIFLK